MTQYNKNTELYSRPSVGDKDMDGGEKKQLTYWYHALKDEVKEVEQIRRNVYSILREENGREQLTRRYENER